MTSKPDASSVSKLVMSVISKLGLEIIARASNNPNITQISFNSHTDDLTYRYTDYFCSTEFTDVKDSLVFLISKKIFKLIYS